MVLARDGASIRDNLVAGLFITVSRMGVLIELTGNVPQWVALGIGVYVVYSWVQSLKARDPVTYHMISSPRP